ncbi:MAG: ABC transporter permease [Verrucomicrobia bacterium]|nr:ABC transporter permease [Verrucomicrobiota bacterium]
MKRLQTTWSKLRSLWQRREVKQEIDEELRFHLEQRTAENITAGMTPVEAAREARKRFGNLQSIREECRERRGASFGEATWQDIRYGLRTLWKNPGFTAVAVLTLALGIGANTAIFSVINGVLLRPLPYPEPDRLVTLWERNPQRGIEQERVSGPNYLDWCAQNSVFSSLSVSPGWEGSETFNLVLGDTTTKIRATYSSSSLFTTLGAKPLLGRRLLPDEDRKEGNRAVVIGYGLWQRHFGGDTNVLGRTLTVDTYGRRDYTIVGVMPPGFGLPSQNELWLPLGWMGVTLTERRNANWHIVVGRLKPDVTLAQAQSEMNAIQARIAQAYSGQVIGTSVSIVPLLDQALGRNLRRGLFVVWGVVAGVLLIACANVANLMLARAVSRQKEMALRSALGASRWRVVRQLLIESILLAMLSGVAGVLIAWSGLNLFIAASPPGIPRLGEVALDGTALAFTLGASLITGIVFGLAPAWQFSRPSPNDVLKEGSRSASTGPAVGFTRNALVVAEVALSVVLLAGAGLMLQSFARMLGAERGFRPEHLLTAELDYSVSGFGGWTRPDPNRPQVSLRELMERLRVYPGVQAVGAGSRLLRQENRPPHESVAIYGESPADPENSPRAEFKGVSPGWVQALGARLLQGRDFTEADTLESPGVVLINEALARRYFPTKNPIGQHLKMGAKQRPPLGATNAWGAPAWSEIIGVVSDVKSLHPQPEVVPEIYQSYWQWPMQNPTVLVRTTADPAVLTEAIRRETKALIPNLPPPTIRTMDDRLSETIAQPRLQTALLSLFAVLALLLAVIGLYGVMAYSVVQRTREFGIRMALGAQKTHVLSLVIKQGMRMVLAGMGIGIAAALAGTQVIQSLLYGVDPTDPITFIAISLLLLFSAFCACWVSARRATKLEPMAALRYE